MSDQKHEKITTAGIYPVTCKWAGTAEIGVKKTPAYKLLFVTADDKSIFGTLWNTPNSQDRLNAQCRAMGLEHKPVDLSAFKGCQCNIVVNEENGYLNVSAILPYEQADEPIAEPEYEPLRTRREQADYEMPTETNSTDDVPF